MDTANTPMAPANTARPGGLPKRRDTATANTLASLLSGKKVRCMDAVRGAGTTRLSGLVFDLRHRYGWPIIGVEVPTGCIDGRTAYVSEYSLPAEAIEAAIARGDSAWVQGVLAAREALLSRKGQS